MTGPLQDVEDLSCCSHLALVAVFDHRSGQIVSFRTLSGNIVKTDDSGVHVEVHMHGDGVSQTVRQPVALRQKHKCRGDLDVELAVTIPERPVLNIIWTIFRLLLNMGQD